MARMNPYLTFNGNCQEAFDFYKSVFGGEFQQISRFKDMPPMEGRPLPENIREKIMHVSLPLGKDSFLMGSDTSPEYGEVSIGQNISLVLNTESKDDADRIFNRLSENGKVTMPMANTFWNSYFGMLTDKFGINWMVSYDNPVREPQGEKRQEVGANI